jgi:DNA repair exonuclease SbcCD ATPase subunit
VFEVGMRLFRKKKDIQNGLTNLHSLLSDSFKNVEKDTHYILSWLQYLYQKNIQQEQLIHTLQTELSYTPKSKEEIKKIVDEFYSYEHIIERIKTLENRIDEIKKSALLFEESHTNLTRHQGELRKLQDELHEKHSELHSEHHSLSQKHTELRHDHHELRQKYEDLGPQIEDLKAQIQHEKLQPIGPAVDLEELKKRLEKLEEKKSSIKEKIIKRITKNSKDYVKSLMISYIKKYGEISALQLKEMVVEEQGLCSKSSFYRLLEEIEESADIGVIKKGKEKHYIIKVSSKNLR